MTIEQAMHIAVNHHEAGRLADAESIYRQVLSQFPNHVGALHFLGVIALQAAKLDAAIDLLGKAIAIEPTAPEIHNNLAVALMRQGKWDEALAACQRAIALAPDFADAHSNLGQVLQRQGKFAEAITAYQSAIRLNPNNAQACCNLSRVLQSTGQIEPAIAAAARAIEINPQLADAHNQLGIALNKRGRLDEAVAAYLTALQINPKLAAVYSNLGNAQKAQGKIDEAIASYRRAIALEPTAADFHSNLCFALNYSLAEDEASLSKENQNWNRQHAQPLRHRIIPHTNERSPNRRLRIGYVSPDFRNHAVADSILLPLLANHSHDEFEIFSYTKVASPDAITERLGNYSDHWNNIYGKSDTEIAGQIRRDEIDILVDLASHTAGNSLLVFAEKPAPVQVTWFTGATGMDTIDYRFTDRYLDPSPADEELRSEQPMHLKTFWCLEPPHDAPDVNPLPALQTGQITFGSLNNFAKINRDTLELWIKILKQIPTSRLIIKSFPGSQLDRVRDLFASANVASNRLDFVGSLSRQDYFHLYHQIDLGLDPFPFNGHTTTFDFLWMGVPIATLAGRTNVGRAGVSILSNIGMLELIAKTPAEYISIAVNQATDLARLSTLRSTLRAKMLASPLTDAPSYARDVESAYRKMWRQWCNRGES